MIIVSIIAVVGAITIPRLRSPRLQANEQAAITMLERVIAAQRFVKDQSLIDSNNDGTGEYGYFQELTGMRNTRIDTNADSIADEESNVAVVPPAFAGSVFIDGHGRVLRSGYLFPMVLPDRVDEFQGERHTGASYPPVSAVLSGNNWACLAWPVSFGESGRRAFFVNQTGRILECDNDVSRYTGSRTVPSPRSALKPGGYYMTSSLAINSTGQDGNYWHTLR
jgi:hypothetical protein